MASVVYKASLQIRQSGRLKLFRSHHPDYRDGEQLRDFVYVKDITRWMWEIFSQPHATSGIYNMGFGKARTWIDLARAVFANMNQPLQIDWVDVPLNIRDQYQYFTEADTRRLMALPVSKSRWSLEEGISDYVKNYLLKPTPYLVAES
jgi:ADP-L-glycero-D-manno-heptose 6-epimerase